MQNLPFSTVNVGAGVTTQSVTLLPVMLAVESMAYSIGLEEEVSEHTVQ